MTRIPLCATVSRRYGVLPFEEEAAGNENVKQEELQQQRSDSQEKQDL